jgi:signal peptidase II
MTENAGATTVSNAGLSVNEGGKVAVYGGLMGGMVLLDQVTKYIATQTLPLYEPVPVLGNFFRLTYIYNPGAAFGLNLGAASRYIFLALTVVCLGVLVSWFRSTPASDRLRLISIALVSAGALGNFIDRARSARGVVDFLDFGLATMRWPVFNVADIGVTVGAILLAISLWREERAES